MRFKQPLGWLLTLAVLLVSSAVAAAETLVVLYPELPGADREIFALMREGVRIEASRHAATVVEIPVQSSTVSTALQARLRAQNPSRVIALGRRAWDLVQSPDTPSPLVVGAVKLPVDDGTGSVRGISAVVNPNLVLSTLRELAPQIQRIHIVIDPERDGWIQKPTTDAARALGLSVVFYEAKTVAEAATRYLAILRDISNPQSDALWLLDNSRFLTADTLPAIVEKSWSRRLVVFSNVVSHVNKGVLFALVPEPRAWGQRLAKQAFEFSASNGAVEFLEDVRRVGNVRVGSHLGRTVDLNVLSRFEIVVGER